MRYGLPPLVGAYGARATVNPAGNMPSQQEVAYTALTQPNLQAPANEGRIYTTSYPEDENGQRTQSTGWYWPWDIVDQNGSRVYGDYHPLVQRARQSLLTAEAAKLQAQNAEMERTQQATQQAYAANQAAGGLQAAGATFAAGALNDPNVRQAIYDNRLNLPGFTQSQPASNFMAMPGQKQSWNPVMTAAQLGMQPDVPTTRRLPGVQTSVLDESGLDNSGLDTSGPNFPIQRETADPYGPQNAFEDINFPIQREGQSRVMAAPRTDRRMLGLPRQIGAV
jgi:hypothetical protein